LEPSKTSEKGASLIRQNNPSITTIENEPAKTYFSFFKTPAGAFRLSLGTPLNFLTKQTVEVDAADPSRMWQLIHEMTGIPLPTVTPVEVPVPVSKESEQPAEAPLLSTFGDQVNELSDKINVLNNLSAAEIVEKVYKEKGIRITLSLKSKKAILRKALTLY